MDKHGEAIWQPISTAPKDWKPVVVWGISEEEWDDAFDEDREPAYSVLLARHSTIQPGTWWMVGASMTLVKHPTFWMPMPPPPSAAITLATDPGKVGEEEPARAQTGES